MHKLWTFELSSSCLLVSLVCRNYHSIYASVSNFDNRRKKNIKVRMNYRNNIKLLYISIVYKLLEFGFISNEILWSLWLCVNWELETYLAETFLWIIIKFMIWGYGIAHFISTKWGEAINAISCKNGLRLHIILCKIVP